MQQDQSSIIEDLIKIEKLRLKQEQSNNLKNKDTNGDDLIPDEGLWNIIESYFKDHHLQRLVRHQIESYNNFIEHQIIKTINMFNPVKVVSTNDYDSTVDKHSLEIIINFSNFNIYKPQIHENTGAIKLMFPHEARLRNFTYTSNISIDIDIKYIIRTGALLENERVIHKTIPKVNIGKLPIMLKSNICLLKQYNCFNNNQSDIKNGECKYDAGGYFIINGSEKTVLGQERPAENRVYCFNISKNNTKYNWVAEIRSVPDYKCISPKQLNIMVSSKHNGVGFPITVQIPRVKQPIPIFILFRALGIISDKDITNKIVLDITDPLVNEKYGNIINSSIIDSNDILTQEAAILYIIKYIMYTPINMDVEAGNKKKREFAIDIITNDLFPHCNTKDSKIYFLGYMTKRVIDVSVGYAKVDDRDSYLNKRIELTGMLLNNLFRNYFNKMVKDMEKHVIREINNGTWRSSDDYENIINHTNIYKIIKSLTIENGIKRSLSTGDFGIKHINSNKVGVAQVLNRLTYASSLSNSRRISTPIDKSGKLIPPRKLHNTSWGFLCPAETPEGQSVGIVKNLSYMAHVTIPSNSDPLYNYVKNDIISLNNLDYNYKFDIKQYIKVIINGSWIGIAKDPVKLYESLKNKKYQGVINIYTAVVFDYKQRQIKICNDGGRLTRPLIKVKDNKVLITSDIIKKLENSELCWDDLFTNIKISESVLEYIDAEEQSFSMIAIKQDELQNKLIKYTHLEIHPSTIFGILASCIPFPEHNQSPRNTYQCAMGKQSMGVYVTNFDTRMDKTSYVLTTPTRPLVDTRIMNMLQLNNIPSGTNVIVAIMTHTGYNQEDSILLNKGSVDRGLFQATIYKTEKDEDKQKVNGDDEIRCKPDPAKTKCLRICNYDKLNSSGFVTENTLIENRDIIMGKVIPIKKNRNDHTKIIKFEDQSKLYKTNEPTYIDKNYTDKNGDGYNFAKIRLRNVRQPVIGDKFSSRHGQKGTVGCLIPEENMPCSQDGVRPDIIINPHAIPSRMTIGQLKETLLGKVLLELGIFGDGTSFSNFKINDICNALLKCGYNSCGNELMYDGMSGEQMECDIFMGPAFYQRLKHMVKDKVHSRSFGPMVNLTRQPAEGRSRDGGLKFGEMERDSMISHGASRFTKGRMYDASDKYSVNVCKKCGLIATYNEKIGIHICNMCDNRTDFSYVEIPYSCKLLFQELMTMNVSPRIIV
jgi:DNA-directed RNA polymerase II subunit RPB2